MNCRKCNKTISDDSVYCNYCGIKQVLSKPRRANSLGSVYKNKNGMWCAEVTLGYETRENENGEIKQYRKKRTKSGFSSKKAAIEYLPTLKQELPQQDSNIKFKDHYEKWLDIHAEKVTKSTINCYKAAFKYYAALHYAEMKQIKTEHLQKCVNECTQGNRTKKNMKSLGTALFKYAMQLDICDRNYAEYIYIKPERQNERLSFSSEQLDVMWENVDTVPELKYILVLCYTGLRIGEMLIAETEKYNRDEQYFVTGSKTKAGKDRIITISPRILPFFNDFGKGKYLFFNDSKPLSEKKFRSDYFYPALQQLGFDDVLSDGTHKYTPHCCRHTFATLMKNIEAPATDKQKLIGHSKFEMTAYYTHTDIESLKNITDKL